MERKLTVPLIVLSVCIPSQYPELLLIRIHHVLKESNSSRLAWHEAPKVLLLAAIAYSRNLRLEHYNEFVVCLEGTFLYVSRLEASQKYMSDLFEHKLVSDDLPLYRSRKFNIFDRGERREIVRILIGVLRCLDGHGQSKIPGDYSLFS